MTITLERTLDRNLIADIMSAPRVYAGLADDFMPAAENFYPADNPSVYHLVARDGEELLGLVITHPINTTLWEVHIALLPEAWGAPAHAIGRAYFAWLWTNTEAQTAIGITPERHSLVRRYAQRQGMQECGRIARAVQKSGHLDNLVIYQKHRPDLSRLSRY